jgi:N-acyl-L-homoserine lactone synthetase
MAQALRYEVYCEEKGWVSPTRSGERLEIDAYDDLATHFLAVDEDGTVLGTVRYLRGEVQRLPAFDHISPESLGLEPRRITEVSRLATRRTSRSQDLGVFLGLTRLMWHWGMENSIRSWMAIADQPLYRLLSRLRIPVLAVGEPIDYLGSECVPVAYDMPGSGAALYRRLDDAIEPVDLHHQLVAKSGLSTWKEL